MLSNGFTLFWIIIAILYIILAIATLLISRWCNNYVKEITEGSGWLLEDDKGNVIKEVGFFEPITRYLTYMMYIDLAVFIIAAIAALASAGIITI